MRIAVFSDTHRNIDGAIAAVEQYHLFDDGKAQACTAGFPGTGLVHAVETIKNVGKIFLGNAYAGV